MSRKRIPQIRKTIYHEAGHVILNILARILPVFSLKMQGYLNLFAFSKAGDLLAYATAGTQAVSVVELKSRQEIVCLHQTNNIAQVAFSADATRLFTYGETGRLIEWDLALKQALRTFDFIPRSFENGRNTVAFSANGKFMAWCREGGVVGFAK